MSDALRLVDLMALVLIAYGPLRSLVRSALDPAGYELRYLTWLESRPGALEMRRTGRRFLVGGPLLLWAAYRAELEALWFALGLFMVLGGLACIWVSTTEPARDHQADYSALDDPPAVHARRRRITQLFQVAFLAAWLFSWRGIAA